MASAVFIFLLRDHIPKFYQQERNNVERHINHLLPPLATVSLLPIFTQCSRS